MFKDKTNLYEIRLNFPSLNSLESRRERGDIIEVFKIMNGYVDVNYNQLFTLIMISLKVTSLLYSNNIPDYILENIHLCLVF